MKLKQKIGLLFAFFVLFFACSKFAIAAEVTFESVLCSAYGLFNGTIGKVFALFALIALGVSFFLGKVSWGTVIAIALGIGAIFGGTAIVNALSGEAGSTTICTTTKS